MRRELFSVILQYKENEILETYYYENIHTALLLFILEEPNFFLETNLLMLIQCIENCNGHFENFIEVFW